MRRFSSRDLAKNYPWATTFLLISSMIDLLQSHFEKVGQYPHRYFGTRKLFRSHQWYGPSPRKYVHMRKEEKSSAQCSHRLRLRNEHTEGREDKIWGTWFVDDFSRMLEWVGRASKYYSETRLNRNHLFLSAMQWKMITTHNWETIKMGSGSFCCQCEESSHVAPLLQSLLYLSQ